MNQIQEVTNLFQILTLIFQQFDAACESIKLKTKELTGVPSDRRLEMEALFKQSTIGDNNSEKPGLLDFKGNAEYNAWESKRGMSRTDAMSEYPKMVKELLFPSE